jgi:hypothetical protein
MKTHPKGVADAGQPGLISRSGYRRIPPVWARDDWRITDDHLEVLQRAMKFALRGHDETVVFTRMVLSPLLDGPRATYRQLAAEMGLPIRRLYKLMERAKAKMDREVVRQKELKRRAPQNIKSV